MAAFPKAFSAFALCLPSFLLTADTNDLAIAREALRDGLWGIARIHAEQVGTAEAKLVVLESLAAEDKWSQIDERLKTWKD